MIRRLAILICLVALCSAWFGSGSGPQPAAATVLPQQPAAIYILRVYVSGTADVTRLTSGGWDVLEARGKDYLLLIGDESVVAALRAQGYTVAVDHAMNTAGGRAPFTYDGGYRTVAEHYQHMDNLAALHPDLALTVTYGLSWQKGQNPAAGSDLRAICITRRQPGDCALNPNSSKPRFFLMAAIHARELTTAELAWRWIDLLINNYNVDPDITALLDYNEMWVVPVANPDGRSIVETTNLYQRKNADTNYCPGNLFGADLNRNASFQWGVSGASSSPCDEIYMGPSPASEPEEYTLETLMQNLFRDQRGPQVVDAAPVTTTGTMLTLHSYSNLVLLPWGWTVCSGGVCPANLRTPNDVALRALAFHMSYFNGYRTGQPSEVLYAASGTTDDWAYGKLGIPGFTFEVGPDDYSYCSFFDPPYSCQDSVFWPQNAGAFLYLAKVSRQPYALGLGPTVQSPTSTLIVPISVTARFTAAVSSNVYGASGVSIPTAMPVSTTQFTIDAPPWISGTKVYSMTAADGAFDSTAETVKGQSPANLGPGRHTLYIHGQDAAGNWGPVTARWLLVAPYAVRFVLIYRN